jgi:8-oxo-dGTP diphosphatase
MAAENLPYKMACLCDLRDDRGRVLLLRRTKSPNEGLCSPIGGKLDTASGESPAMCALREIKEEAGIDVAIDDLHLMGLVAERAYEGAGHWLMFVYRVTRPVEVPAGEIREGLLEWFDPSEIDDLPLPETDRKVIWPMIRANERADGAHGFFSVHIDCTGDELAWTVEHSSGSPFEPNPGR